ncbi:Uncharacterized protein GBIM_13618 [Gryllus bimaculatus]|nr:Uncharacterized protein GBIM_13618 [Gryllus bimaculatus]
MNIHTKVLNTKIEGGVSKQDPKESVKFLPEEKDASTKDKAQNDENVPLAATTNVNERQDQRLVNKIQIRKYSDTESADHGPTHSSKKSKTKFSNIFKKKGDKVGDDSSVTKPAHLEDIKEVDSPVPQRSVQPQQQQLQTGQPPHVARQPAPDSIVYAELDLKDLGDRRPQVRPDEERTEYAEILYTAKPAGGPEHTSPPQP